jgi:hypothetical protein
VIGLVDETGRVFASARLRLVSERDHDNWFFDFYLFDVRRRRHTTHARATQKSWSSRH